MFLIALVVFAIGALERSSAVGAASGERSAAAAQFVPGQVIVKFRSGNNGRQARDFAVGTGGRVVKKLLNPRTWLFKFRDTESLSKLLRRLKQDPNVVFAEPNGYVRADFAPNDPRYDRQWNFSKIKMGRAWDRARGSGAVVAVVDTGVAYENYNDGSTQYRRISDLAGTSFVSGYDFANNDTHANDDNQHGTHVAGTIAQTTNNRRGVAGIAFNASIMPVKVLDSGGFGTFDDVADGIRWAADHGAHVINLSLGSSSPSSAMEDAVNYARNTKNVVVVAAAGNSGTSSLSYPAAYPSVISVAATDLNNTLAWYSQYGNGLDISAPGGDTGADVDHDGRVDGILQQTIYENNPSRAGYFYFQGTSMATPHVAGVAALIRSRGIRRAAEITNALKGSATDLGSPGYDTRYGYGLVNANRALQYRRMVTPILTAPASGAVLSGGSRTTLRWNRRRATKLRYHLSYSPNAAASGTFSDGFESGAVSSAYTQGGNADWAATTVTSAAGSYSARSGALTDSQSSEMSLTKTFSTASVIGFAYRVSSESGYDFLDVYIDDVRQLHVSGSSGWISASYSVAAGQHTIRWVYSKDYSVSEGLDSAFIDDISLPNTSQADWYKIVKTTQAGADSYPWTVPAAAGSNYQIRIRAYNGSYGEWSYGPYFTVN